MKDTFRGDYGTATPVPSKRPAVPASADRVAVTIHTRTVNGTNERVHWSVRSRRAAGERSAVNLAVYDVPLEVRSALAAGCVVKMTRVSVGTLDDDGLRSALKHVRDAVAMWLLGGGPGEMDSDPRITWEYAQRRGKRGDPAVDIEILPR